MIRKFFFSTLALALVLIIGGCEKTVDEREADELLRLQAYIWVNYHLTNTPIDSTESGLYYIIHEEGDGEYLQEDDFLLFNVTGQNLDDYVYETTFKDVAKLHEIYSPRIHYSPKYVKYIDENRPLIEGLTEGLSFLREGAKARLIMPASLAYGSTRHQGLYPFSSVILDVELQKAVPDPVEYESELIDNYISTNFPNWVKDSTTYRDGLYFLKVLVEHTIDPDNDDDNNDDENDEDDNGDDSFDNNRPQPIKDGDIVEVYYTGRFVDGWVFDTNEEDVAIENDIYDPNKNYLPLSINVGSGGFIEGFSMALKNLTTKTRAKIIIPSQYAYGEQGDSNIPPYTPLVFDIYITIKTFNKPDAEE